VRTPSPAGGRAEFVVPARGSVGAGTGMVSSVGVGEGAACWPGPDVGAEPG
jgi:hypothetical protein